jgi:hypothetical protein
MIIKQNCADETVSQKLGHVRDAIYETGTSVYNAAGVVRETVHGFVVGPGDVDAE